MIPIRSYMPKIQKCTFTEAMQNCWNKSSIIPVAAFVAKSASHGHLKMQVIPC